MYTRVLDEFLNKNIVYNLLDVGSNVLSDFSTFVFFFFFYECAKIICVTEFGLFLLFIFKWRRER